MHHHPEALARMEAHAEKRGVVLNEARMRMARTPLGASLITNPISAAPGFTIENVHVMAGVPSVFQAMVAELLPTLRTGTKIYSRTVVSNLGEGTVAKGLEKIQNKYPSIDIGSYPFFKEGVYGTSLVLRGVELNDLEIASKDIFNLIIEYGGNPSYGDEN